MGGLPQPEPHPEAPSCTNPHQPIRSPSHHRAGARMAPAPISCSNMAPGRTGVSISRSSRRIRYRLSLPLKKDHQPERGAGWSDLGCRWCRWCRRYIGAAAERDKSVGRGGPERCPVCKAELSRCRRDASVCGRRTQEDAQEDPRQRFPLNYSPPRHARHPFSTFLSRSPLLFGRCAFAGSFLCEAKAEPVGELASQREDSAKAHPLKSRGLRAWKVLKGCRACRGGE